MSTAAKINPPRSPRFLRSWTRCWARLASSVSSQNRYPAYVVGTIEPMRASDARRGNFPIASRAPPPTWTMPLSLTNVRMSSRAKGSPSVGGGMTDSTGSPFPSGCRSASQPSAMKIEAKRGRAIRRERVTSCLYPPRHEPSHRFKCPARAMLTCQEARTNAEIGRRPLEDRPTVTRGVPRPSQGSGVRSRSLDRSCDRKSDGRPTHYRARRARVRRDGRGALGRRSGSRLARRTGGDDRA